MRHTLTSLKMLLPASAVLEISKIHHVGTLALEDRGKQFAQSHEGCCLSVSRHPESWRRIARLGDAPTWELTCPNGAFVEVRAALSNSPFAAALGQWGLERGLLSPRQAWKAWFRDEEADTWCFTVHATEQEAREEIEESDEQYPEGEAVTALELLTGTPRLSARMSVDLSLQDALPFCLIAWLDDETEFDGPYWDELHDPAVLSAPRAGILPSRLGRWSRVQAVPPR